MGAGRRRPELLSWQREQEQPQVNARLPELQHRKTYKQLKTTGGVPQFGIIPERLSLPYPDEEILSGYEEDFSSIRDGFSAWVKTDPEA